MIQIIQEDAPMSYFEVAACMKHRAPQCLLSASFKDCHKQAGIVLPQWQHQYRLWYLLHAAKIALVVKAILLRLGNVLRLGQLNGMS